MVKHCKKINDVNNYNLEGVRDFRASLSLPQPFLFCIIK
jgi:hypothetical protein